MNEWSIPLSALILSAAAIAFKAMGRAKANGASLATVWEKVDAVRLEVTSRVDGIGSDIAKRWGHWQEALSEKYDRELADIRLRMDRLEDRFDTFMDFIMRRARVEQSFASITERAVPITLDVTTITAITPFLMEVIHFYGEHIHQVPRPDDRDIFAAIEQRFGDRIVEQICIPRRLHLGACLMAIMDACKTHYGEAHG